MSTSSRGGAPGPKSFVASAAAAAPMGCFNKMGAVVSTLSEAWNDLCGGRRMSGLEERIAELEASQQRSVALGLCCAAPSRTSIR